MCFLCRRDRRLRGRPHETCRTCFVYNDCIWSIYKNYIFAFSCALAPWMWMVANGLSAINVVRRLRNQHCKCSGERNRGLSRRRCMFVRQNLFSGLQLSWSTWNWNCEKTMSWYSFCNILSIILVSNFHTSVVKQNFHSLFWWDAKQRVKVWLCCTMLEVLSPYSRM